MHSGHLKALEPLSLPQPIMALLIGAAEAGAMGDRAIVLHVHVAQ